MSEINRIKNDTQGKYNGNETEYILQVLDSENLDRKKNPFVNRLEKKYAEVFQTKYAIAHNSCTSALHTIFLSLGLTTISMSL